MAIHEGRWNCKHCTRVNRGGSVECEGCGRDRPSDTIFYLPEDEPPVTDPKKLAQAASGPDKHCPYCDAVLRGSKCEKCGSTTRTPYEVLTFPKRVDYSGPARHVSGLSEARPLTTQEYANSLRSAVTWGAIMLGISAVLAVLYFMTFGSRMAKLQNKTWERVIKVEQLRTVQESAWHNHVPAGARQIRTYSAIRDYVKIRVGTDTAYRTESEQVQIGTKRVKTGTRDMGNGFFEDVYKERPVYKTVTRQVPYEVPRYATQPVYDTKVEYDIDRWVEAREYSRSGINSPPHWPEFPPKADERPGRRTETYKAVFVDSKGQLIEKTVDAAKYDVLKAEVNYKLNTAFGSVTDIQELQAEKQ